MKRTGKTLTLSGQLPQNQFGRQFGSNPQTILEYSNVLDINKAWKVVSYRVWVHETEASQMGFVDESMFTLYSQLNTDAVQNVPAIWNNAEINRAIGFSNTLYNCTAPAYRTGVFSDAGVGIQNQSYFIQPEHIIQNNLVLATKAKGSGIGTENGTYTVNYIVYLEEYDISANESIVFNIKSKGQDLSQ
ncbi:MAG: hypothetical protein [Circular genetic element sp.]|nr:MAG: hypothetical protein [Circular genetic element sp.]